MEWPWSILVPFLAAAWFGHAFLMTVLLNWWYAQPVRRVYLKIGRALIALLVFGFPFAIGFLAGNRIEGWFGGYLWFCVAITAIYLPLISWSRWRRPQPTAVVGNASRIVDATEALGDKPVGNGSHWRLACLPGNQVFQVELRDLNVRLPRWPVALDGLSVLHLSDVHLSGTPGRPFYQCVFDEIMRSGPPDILAVTGDIVDSPHHHRWIVPLLGRLRWRVAAFAILGNHDKYYEPELVRRRLRRLGIRVIGNGCEQIDVRGVPLLVVGNEAPWFRPPPDLSAAPRDVFRMCLSHTPDQFGWAQQNGIDLMLAGHVHGGQIRLPLIGPLFVPSRFSRRYDSGQFASGPTLMIVSRGLAGREPLRYNCRPEISRIILNAGRPASQGCD